MVALLRRLFCYGKRGVEVQSLACVESAPIIMCTIVSILVNQPSRQRSTCLLFYLFQILAQAAASDVYLDDHPLAGKVAKSLPARPLSIKEEAKGRGTVWTQGGP